MIFTLYLTTTTVSFLLLSGDFCEREKCPQDHYCLNGGKCAVVNQEFVCYCLKGFSGAICEFEVKITSHYLIFVALEISTLNRKYFL